MNTLIIVASLFSVQPSAAQFDSQWLDLQNMRDQVRAYVVEDVANVSKALSEDIYSTLSEGISVGSKFFDQQGEVLTLTARQEQASDTAAEPAKSQVN